MKKIFVAASLLVASFAVKAQEYKPVAGNVTAEVGLTGGIFNTVTDLNTSGLGVNQLKFRYFLADQMALRVGVNFSSNNVTDKFYEAAPGSGVGKRKEKNTTTLLNLGVEKHFSGTDRLSTYVGADLTILSQGVKEKWEDYDGTGFSAGTSRNLKGRNDAGTATSSFGYGLRVVIGGDYYFVEKVYLGTEFGWGFITQKDREVTDEFTTPTGTTTTKVKSPGTDFNLNPAVYASVRLGFRF